MTRMIAINRANLLPWLGVLMWLTLATAIPPGWAAEPVVLQLRWDHQFQFAGYYAALWQGYYREAGLAVALRSAVKPDGTVLSAIDEVAAGRADFGIGAADILLARERGIPLVVLATLFQESAVEFYARPDTVHAFPADLPRLRVVRRVNDLTDVELQALLVAEGIKPSLIEPYPLTLTHGYLAALAEGQVDVVPGYAIGTPQEAQRIGLEIVRFRPASFGIHFYGDSLFTHQRVLERDPALVERFIEASLRGWRYALTHPEEIAKRIIREFQPAFPIADYADFVHFQIEPVRQLTLFPLVAPGHMNPHRWQQMHTLLKKSGLVSGTLDLDTFLFDPERRERERQARQEKVWRYSLGIAVLASVVFFLWTRTLRRTVTARTTALQASEQALRENEKRLRAIADYTYDWESWLSPTGQLLWVNPGVERQTGYSVGECLAMVDYPLPMIHSDHRAAMAYHLRKAICGASANDIEFRILCKNGQPAWAAASWQSLYNARGQSLGSRISIRNITERKRAEAALQRAHDELEARVQARTTELTAANAQLASEITAHRQAEQARVESERRLQALFDNALDAILLADNTGRFIAANPAACQLVGATQAQVLQLTVWDITPPDQRLQAQALWQTFVTTEGRQGGEYVLCRQDGTTVVAEYRAVAHILPGLHLSILRDISQRKAAEARAQQHQAALAHTARLTIAGELAAGLAHELNQPLCAMTSYAETGEAVLRLREFNRQQLAELFHKISEQGVRTSAIIRRLRQFLRKSEPHRDNSDVNILVREVLQLADPQIHQAGVRVQLKLAAVLPALYVDTIQIQQVVLNLLSNSLEAMQEMPAAKRRLTLGTTLAGDTVEITVSDTGPGLSAEAEDQLFQPFFTTKTAGMGLGLSLSRSIVEAHGGRLWATSNPQQGVTFHCALPYGNVDAMAATGTNAY